MKKNKVKLLPTIHDIKTQDEGVILNLTINADLRCFQGHFDDAAVVPGVVQLDWAVIFAREYLSMQGTVLDVNVLKFQKLLTPDMRIELSLIKKSANKFTFNYSFGEEKFSSARVEMSA